MKEERLKKQKAAESGKSGSPQLGAFDGASAQLDNQELPQLGAHRSFIAAGAQAAAQNLEQQRAAAALDSSGTEDSSLVKENAEEDLVDVEAVEEEVDDLF